MKKLLIVLFIFFAFCGYAEDKIKEPDDPKYPVISDDNAEDLKTYGIDFQNQSGKLGRGSIKKKPDAGFTLILKDNDTREINLDQIRSVRVKGYTMMKKTKENLSAVYYLPYYFDIVLRDGTELNDAKGRMPEFDSFTAETKTGRKRYYTYFGRYWLEDKKIFNDNKSGNYNEKPKVPNAVVIFIEFD